MNGPYLVGVDVGTTGAKAVVARAGGRIVAEHAASYEVLTPRPLWAEQWPQVWLDGLGEAVRGALAAAAVAPDAVAALTVSSLYGGSGIPVDDRLEPVRPCLIWMDRRARAQTERVKREVDLDRLVAITGNGVDSYYGFTKILWLRDQEPDAWDRTRWLLPPNAWLIERLTGELAVDHSSAGNIGGVYDVRAHAWSSEACDLLGLPVERFPERLVASHDVVGELHAAGAQRTGLAAGTPVCAGGVDAAVATLSAGVFHERQHVCMLGTSMCWGFIHHEPPREAGLVSMPYVLEPLRNTYTFGGAATAGAVPAWFHDQLAGVERAVEAWTGDVGGPSAYEQLEARAAQVPAGSDGLLMLPYLMGERSPIWDPDARGTLIGLTLVHTKAHLYRAFLEGVAFALRHNVEAGRAAGYELEETLRVVGGGARSSLWMDILASVTGMPVSAARGGEAAFGDAMLGAVGVGLAAPDDLPAWVDAADLQRRREPDAEARRRYDALYPHYVGLYQDLRERFAALAHLDEEAAA
jgi:xylulokinase